MQQNKKLSVHLEGKKPIILEKKRHTIKAQLVVAKTTLEIISVMVCKGSIHDFELFKRSRLKLPRQARKLVDLGYQGLQKMVENVCLPHKKPKGASLSELQKKENRLLAQKRVFIEHVNRRCKIFRITKETYRGKHRNFGKTWNLVAGLVNLRFPA
jgi:DDE superfamily endonuclease